MEKKDYIFNYKSDNGLSDFGIAVLKLLIEDRDFFKANIQLINQNDFIDLWVRESIGRIKDLWYNSNILPSYDTLVIWKKSNDQYYEEFLEEVKKIKLTPERIEEVKQNFMYLNLFACFCRVHNSTSDSFSDGLTPNNIVRAVEKALEEAENLKVALNNIGVPVTNNDRYNDEDF